MGQGHGCLMSLLMLNVYINGVVRELNASVLSEWLKLLDQMGGGIGSSVNCCFVDVTALVTDPEEK